MLDLFREGGFGTIPTALFGLLLVAAALAYAARPEKRLVPLQISLCIVTLSSGGLGFVSGVVKSFSFLGQVKPEDRWIGAVGVAESLQNLVLAFALVTLAAIATSVGALRIARSTAAS